MTYSNLILDKIYILNKIWKGEDEIVKVTFKLIKHEGLKWKHN